MIAIQAWIILLKQINFITTRFKFLPDKGSNRQVDIVLFRPIRADSPRIVPISPVTGNDAYAYCTALELELRPPPSPGAGPADRKPGVQIPGKHFRRKGNKKGCQQDRHAEGGLQDAHSVHATTWAG